MRECAGDDAVADDPSSVEAEMASYEYVSTTDDAGLLSSSCFLLLNLCFYPHLRLRYVEHKRNSLNSPGFIMANRGKSWDTQVHSIADLREYGSKKLPKMYRDYYNEGAMDLVT